MCGIVGYAGGRPDAVSPELFDRMRDALSHRGPDGAGTWRNADGRVALGHRRLAIIDLSPGGHQPMSRAGGRYWITFNGEIYNFRPLRQELSKLGHSFQSESDTEVLLAAYQQWGRDCLQKLVGMFVFAIYDAERNMLFAARDRAGEKPLFYRTDRGTLYFASELKALFADPESPRRISRSGLSEYLAYGYVARGNCLLEGYHKLPAGHWLEFDCSSGALRQESYWTLPKPAATGSDDELVEELDHLLEESIKGQLIADVPLGILLSGGLDSSLVAAVAARVSGRPIKTYTVGFPGHADHDESHYARHVADYLGSDHTELPAEAATWDVILKLVGQFDEPIADSSMIPTFLVSQMIRKECTVALGGDGGDELFGGYLHHPWLLKYEKARRLGLHRLGLEPIVSRMIPFGTPARSAVVGLFAPTPPETSLFRLLDPAVRRYITQDGASDRPELERAALVADRHTVPDRFLALEFMTYMCDDILTKVDRSSMLNSLEVRAPLLDHRLVEFAFARVPARLKVHQGQRKRILRALAAKLLPRSFDSSRKQGFSIPIGDWMAGAWKPLISDLLDQGSPLFERKRMQRILRRMQANDRGAHRIFQLAILEAWRRQHGIQL